MELWKKLPLVLILGLAIAFFGVGCDSGDDEEIPPLPEGYLELETHNLDFGTSINEQQLTVSNTGDTSLTWNVTNIPFWIEVDPTSGSLAADGQTQVTIRVYRVGVGPGATSATLMFGTTNYNDDSLTVSLERTCGLLGDDFNDGGAAGWNATAMDVSQHADGYVVLDPTSALEAARLMQNVAPTMPCVISARLKRTELTTDYPQYGILVEGTTTEDAIYFTVFVDDTMNYTLEQSVTGGEWEILHYGLTGLLSTAVGEWNILRLELYQDAGITYARGYAGTATTPLFNVALDESLNFVKMGVRSEDYTIHADWFCATQ